MKLLEKDLHDLQQGLVTMAEMAERMVENAVRALTAADRDGLMSQVHAWEAEMDQMELRLDRQAIRLLTVHSPAAHDLRFAVAASRINSELERVGDNAVNVCESIGLLTSSGVPAHDLLLELAGHVREMVAAHAMLGFEMSDHRLDG